MNIQNIQRINGKNASRITADVVLDGKTKTLFIEVGSRYRDFLSADATPFVTALLFIAMKRGEDIFVEGALATGFAEASRKVIARLLSWNVGFKNIKIHADGITSSQKKGKHVGLFFSGGVDSHYTYLKNKKTISHLVFVHGMDIGLSETALLKTVKRHIARIAKQERVSLITVRTNIREISDRYISWKYGHGSILMSVSFALSQQLRAMFVSGGMYKKALRPYGTHPDLDNLWSLPSLRIRHFGHHVDRLAKIAFITKFPQAISRLRVCWVNTRNAYNCGKCEKCLRTMISLYTSNVLSRSKTFPNRINPTELANLYIEEKNHFRYFRENLMALQRMNKDDALIPALQSCLAKNERPPFSFRVLMLRGSVAKIDATYMHGFLFRVLHGRSTL